MQTWTVNVNPNRLSPELVVAELDAGAERAFAHLEELGATGIRVDLFWHWLMPEPGVVNAEAVDWYRRFFEEAKARGFAIFTLLYHPPGWAMALLDRDEDAFLAAWGEFCTLVGTELGALMDVVQVWNEPNNFLAVLKQDPMLFHERRIGPVAIPLQVRWRVLAGLFKVARQTLPAGTLIAYNVLANLSPFLPFKGTWIDWESFTDTFMALAGDCVDVIALDHYPDTWAPGTGPLDWECLEVARRKVNTEGSSWYGKTVIIGEVGYSCAPNFHLLTKPFKVGKFFPGDRCENTMAEWYAAAMTHLGKAMSHERFPHNQIHMVNIYELYDAPKPVGSHAALALEDHFGLIRRDGSFKPAFHVLQAICRNELAFDLETVPAPKLPAYWHLARWGQKLQARIVREPAGIPLALERVVPKAAGAVDAGVETARG